MKLTHVIAISAAIGIGACGQPRTDTNWNENYRTVCTNAQGMRVDDDKCDTRRTSSSSGFFYMYIPFMYSSPGYGGYVDSRYSYRDRTQAFSSASAYRKANPTVRPLIRPSSVSTQRGGFGTTASSTSSRSTSS